VTRGARPKWLQSLTESLHRTEEWMVPQVVHITAALGFGEQVEGADRKAVDEHRFLDRPIALPLVPHLAIATWFSVRA
jgi:hypothetical protein